MIRQRKIELQKKRRRAAIIAAVVLAVIVIAAVCASKSDNSVEAETDTYIEYYVKPGDTLWDIAKEHSNNNVDLRDFIREIEEKNQLTSAFIYIGDTLLIPARYNGG